MIYNVPPTREDEKNLPLNYSIRNVYNETTYELNKDFFVHVSPDLLMPIALKIGVNEIRGQIFQVSVVTIFRNI